jgi:hypothetical protein
MNAPKVVPLRSSTPSRQSTSARLLIGACWIALLVESREDDAEGLCVVRRTYAHRTQDVDVAVSAVRSLSPLVIEARLTPQARVSGNGEAFAQALMARGVPVRFGLPDAREDELRWVDTPARTPLEELAAPDFPLPVERTWSR